MKKAFIYVGHSHWGKSWTLRVLTNGKKDKKTFVLEGIWFWVRKMSNDDEAEGLLGEIMKIPASWYDHFVLAYCPSHLTDDLAREILEELGIHCKPHFFVQDQRFGHPSRRIPEEEITALREIGVVEVLSGQHEYTVRAARFLKFIQRHL